MSPGRPWPQLLIGVLGVVVVVMLQVPPAGAQSDEVEAARQRVAELEAQQQELARLIEETWVAQVVAEEELDRIAEELRNAESDLWLAKSALEDLAVTLYMDVTTGKNVSLWLADGPESLEAGVGYLEVLGIAEEAVWSRYRTVTDGLGRQEVQYRSQLDRLEEIRAEQETLFSQLLETLDTAQQELVLLESLSIDLDEPSTTTTTIAPTTSTTTTTTPPTTTPTTTTSTTTTTAPTTTTSTTTTTTTPPTTTAPTTTTSTTTTTTTPPTTTTTRPPTTTTPPTTTPQDGYNFQGACPVDDPNTFVDTWGAPRSGGRTHQGVDILAARGTAVRAIHEGILFRVDRGGLGGLFIWLRSPWGDEYYYAHLDGFGPGTRTGVPVDQGDLIGYVGTTGNSPANVPHLHFEYHPGGGRAVNPYELAVAACD